MSFGPEQSTPERLVRLATRLLERTRLNEVTWKEATSTAFFTKVGSYYFQVESEDRDGNHPYLIRIEATSSMGSQPLTGLSTREESLHIFTPLGDWKQVISELYKEARKQGSTVEKALNDMLQRVEGDNPLDDDLPF